MQLRNLKIKSAMLSAAVLAASIAPAHAAIIISEVAPWGSGNGTYAADWFELTNTGASAVNISGWKVDDNSNSSAAALTLRGVTSLGAGQSAVFLESNSSGSGDAALDAAFVSAWFGANAPAGLLIGNYGGSGVGLSTSSDAVNIFNGSGALITRVDFGTSTTGRSFDNVAGLNNAAISQLSAVGVNGAFTSFNGAEVGSPGQVPLPAALPMFLSAFGLLGGAARLRKQK